jgi:hypothetical protein
MDVYGEDVACMAVRQASLGEWDFHRSAKNLRKNYRSICRHTKADGGENSEDKIEANHLQLSTTRSIPSQHGIVFIATRT